MNIAILDVKHGNRDPKKSITVAYRNLLVLKNEFDADLFASVRDINFNKKYHVIICGFGSMSTERYESTRFIDENPQARIFWLVGEYEQSTFAPLFYSKRWFTVIKNFRHQLKNKMCKQQKFIDINTLLYRGVNGRVEKKYDCVYWGRWRKDRAVYFKKYLNEDIMISTSSKNMKRFINAGCTASFCKTMKWVDGKEALNLFKYSIYIEDVFTHTHYNCLGNRFYEAVFCNVVQFFDINCKNTIKESGLLVDDYFYVRDGEELSNKIKESNYDNLIEKQAHFAEFAESRRSEVISLINHTIRNGVNGEIND